MSPAKSACHAHPYSRVLRSRPEYVVDVNFAADCVIAIAHRPSVHLRHRRHHPRRHVQAVLRPSPAASVCAFSLPPGAYSLRVAPVRRRLHHHRFSRPRLSGGSASGLSRDSHLIFIRMAR